MGNNVAMSQSEIPAIDPAEFASLVAEASDDQLKEGLATNRDQILGEIFSRMPERFDPQRAAEVDAVVEWRIRDRPGGGHDEWHLLIEDGACRVVEGPADSPTVTLEISPLNFIKLITNNASGPRLFLFGKLKITGNLGLAVRLPSFFRIPGAED
jgi:putative sterol carrier protein